MQKAAGSLALVGKNLSACVAALHLHEALGPRLSWFQTLKDPDAGSDKQRLLLNHLQRNQLKISIEDEIVAENPRVFIGSHRHYPSTALIHYVRSRLSECPYLALESPAVIAKALAVGLWNDLSPAVLDEKGNPRPRWIQEVPDTMKNWEAGSFSLVRRDRLIAATVAKISEKKSRADFERRRVLGIDQSTLRDGTQVIFNAPFGGENFQSLLWTSSLYSVKDEGAKKLRFDFQSAADRVGFWKTFTTEVPSSHVAFMPFLSLWIPDDEPSLRFRKTGLLDSLALRRVMVLPAETPGYHVLQVQVLHFYDNPSAEDRHDTFLWAFCPFLKNLNLAFKESKVEENLLFRSPFSSHLRLAPQLDFWQGGVDCGFRKVPKFQWGIDSRRRPREETQASSSTHS